MQEEYLQKIQRTVLALNQNGLSYLSNQQQSPQAFDYFKKAEKILLTEIQISQHSKKKQQLLAVTYNNLAIYYKRTNKPKAALTYLKKALELQTLALGDELAAASTHLNICAIYSFIGKHHEAMEHAELSIAKAQKAKSTKKQDKNELNSCDNVILASKYNLAVEYEYLKKLEEALQTYKFSQKLAKQLNRKGIQSNSEEAILRVEKSIKTNRRHALQLILKKKQNEERGHYQSMRRNKKNYKNNGEDSVMQTRVKRYRLYDDTKRGTKSVEKFRKVKPLFTQPHNENKDICKQSSLPEIKMKNINQLKTSKNEGNKLKANH